MRTSSLPRLKTPDSTLSLLTEGYDFVSRRCDQLDVDGFRTRLMLRPVTFLRGPKAVRVFYAPGRMCRRSAMPGSVLALLQGSGALQELDDEAHWHRRAMFLGLMTPAALDRARELFREEWQIAAAGWPDRVIVLSEEIGPILTRTALRWSGLDPRENAPALRCEELGAMIEGAARIGPTHWRARMLRHRAEVWAQEQVRAARAGVPAQGTPLEAIAQYRNLGGLALPRDLAASELLNLLRPIVAVGRYIVYSAHAMAAHPRARAALIPNEAGLRAWGDEVRRYYPFFPLVGGRVIRPFRHDAHRFAQGDWVLLDLYASNHHPAAWRDPDRFDPARHHAPPINGAFVPQGAGALRRGHRCPGEALTVALLSEATMLLCESGFDAPEQELSIPHGMIPPWPASGMRIRL